MRSLLAQTPAGFSHFDDSNREEFAQAGSSPFKPYPDKPTTMSYFEIPPEVLEEAEELVRWAKRSLAIQK